MPWWIWIAVGVLFLVLVGGLVVLVAWVLRLFRRLGVAAEALGVGLDRMAVSVEGIEPRTAALAARMEELEVATARLAASRWELDVLLQELRGALGLVSAARGYLTAR